MHTKNYINIVFAILLFSLKLILNYLVPSTLALTTITHDTLKSNLYKTFDSWVLYTQSRISWRWIVWHLVSTTQFQQLDQIKPRQSGQSELFRQLWIYSDKAVVLYDVRKITLRIFCLFVCLFACFFISRIFSRDNCIFSE